MKNIRQNVPIFLLVVSVLVGVVLLAYTASLIGSSNGGVSVAEDCNSPGSVCDSHGCRLDKGESWCDSAQQCNPAGKECSGGAGGSQPPSGGGKDVCSGSSPTSPICFNQPAGSIKTLSDGAKCQCQFTNAPLCGCKVISACRGSNTFDAACGGQCPTGQREVMKCQNGDIVFSSCRFDATCPQPQVVPDVLPIQCPAQSGNVCSTRNVGTFISTYNCRCDNTCNCKGAGTGTLKSHCLSDYGCIAGLKCLPSIEGLTCQEPITQSPTPTVVEANGYTKPTGPSCFLDLFKCLSDKYECVDNLYCRLKVDNLKNQKLRFATKPI